jgi:capsular exopolysaccharide synthesis family protein
LANYLTGHISREEMFRSTQVPGFSWISAGAVPPNPVSLLHSQMFRTLLQELRQQFDHVIIDTPPILGFADGRDVATMMDAVVLVVRHHATPKPSGRLASQLLRQINAPVIGVVLNQVEAYKLGYGHYYYDIKQYEKYYHKES